MTVLPAPPLVAAAAADRAVNGHPAVSTVDCTVTWAPAVDDDRGRSWLNPAEIDRYAAIRLPAARARFVTGRALTRTLVGAATGTAPRDVPLVCSCPTCGGPHGRPAVPGSRFDISITHSGGLVGVAMIDGSGGYRVGLDVEDSSPARAARAGELPGLCAVALHRDEQAGVLGGERTHAERWRRFARYWCRKEAVVKADGAGLDLDLTSFAVSAPDAVAAVRRWPGAAVPTLRDVVLARRSRPDAASWAAAVCVLGPRPVHLRLTQTSSQPTPVAVPTHSSGPELANGIR